MEVINKLFSFAFARKLKPTLTVGEPRVDLHGFSDGSELGYEASIFLRWQMSDGTYTCVPVITKSFVALLKKKTIPRLKRSGCLTLTRMYTTCCEAVDFAKFAKLEKVDRLSDSPFMVETPPRKFPFVSVRVAEIQEAGGVDIIQFSDLSIEQHTRCPANLSLRTAIFDDTGGRSL